MKRLSIGSVNSPNLQGGPYNAAEAKTFATRQHSEAATQLRVWDDFAKDLNAKTPPPTHCIDRTERILVGPGKFILVVGPSGAGKDTLIDAARAHFAHDPRFVFPRRTVTRPCESEIEEHDTVSDIAFQQMAASGMFCLHWQAHGLRYGISMAAARAITEGHTVVINVSRSVIDTAKTRFGRVSTVTVTAPRGVLMARLAARNRATDGDLANRVDRDVGLPEGTAVEIVNDGPIHESISAFLNAIEAAS